LAAKNYLTAELQQDTWNHYLMLRFVSAHIPWNDISNIEQRWSFNASRGEQVLPSDSTLSTIFWRDYLLTVSASTKQLPSGNKICLALDWWIST